MSSHVDVLIVGGGAAGCVLAARVSEDSRLTVALLEAGPDYGPFHPERWPAELLNARAAARGHDWYPGGPSCCARARVIGGSSAHNGCWAILGAPADYDAWAGPSHGVWNDRVLRPYLEDAMRRLRVRPVEPADRSPWHEAVLEATRASGIPYLEDVNAAATGAGWVPLNAVGAIRWHAAFAYLDPVRERRNLRILPGHTAVRLLFDGQRATGVETASDGVMHAGTVVLCAGAYGTPPVLMRSGVGPESVLERIGAPIVLPSPGVGAHLTDHSGMGLLMTPRQALIDAMADPASRYFAQTLIKARSSVAGDEVTDIHIVPSAGPGEDAQGRYNGPLSAGLYVFTVAPRSRGQVRAVSMDPADQPVIDHGYCTDADGHDVQVVRDGLEIAAGLAASPQLGELATPQPGDRSPDAIRDAADGYWHPAGSCAMGPADDPMSVTDAWGKVHGLENVFIADASLMPVIPRANTHLTTVAVADRLGESLTAHLVKEDGTP